MSERRLAVAIHGASCTGKTTAAQDLSSSKGWTVRDCGDIVRARATEIGCKVSDLPISEHKAIDNETMHLVNTAPYPMVIEGCFLPYVLKKHERVIYLQMVCSEEIRQERHSEREKKYTLQQRDESDSKLVAKLYGVDVFPATCGTKIDTSQGSREAVVEGIVRVISERLE